MPTAKYNFPSSVGETTFIPDSDISNPKSLRTSATMRGTRYGQFLRVQRVAGGYNIECLTSPPIQAKRTVTHVRELKIPKELNDALKTLTLLVLDIKSTVDQLSAKLNE